MKYFIGGQTRKITSHISSSLSQYRRYFVPTFKVKCDGTPYHSGTAFGIEHKGRRYMVTAAHVLEKDECNECDSENELFVAVNDALTQIRTFDQVKIYANTQLKEQKNPFDLLLIFPNEFDLSTVFTHFFKKENWYKSRLHEHLYAAACGFPATKNSADNSARKLSSRPFGYFGRISHPSKCKKVGFDSSTHFCLDILLKKIFTTSQREIKAPKPHGISGGPVLVVHDFGQPKSLMQPLLRGIALKIPPNINVSFASTYSPSFLTKSLVLQKNKYPI